MRLFIAIFLPDALAQDVAAFTDRLYGPLQAQTAAIQWCKPDNYHLTVKFLGECPEDRVESLAPALESIVSTQRPFWGQLGALDAFPEKGGVNTLWLGMNSGSISLIGLAERVEAACTLLGFSKEARSFQPHLTLAKVKSAQDPQAIRAILKQTPPPEWKPFTVDALFLVRSILTPSGPTYARLKSFQFK